MPSKVDSTVSAASGIRDVIASCTSFFFLSILQLIDFVDRRAQYLVVDSTRASTRAEDEIVLSDEDEEALVGHFDGHGQEAQCIPIREGPSQDEFVSQLEWDEDSIASNLLNPAAASPGLEQPLIISESFQVYQSSSKCSRKPALPGMLPAFLPKLGETTPLLNPHKQITRKVSIAEHGEHRWSNVPCHVVRRQFSNGSIPRSVKSTSTPHGQSTFGQTVSWSRCALNLA